jgi:hypothetical protein
MVLKSFKITAVVCLLTIGAWIIATTRVPRAPAAKPCTQEWFSDLEKSYFDISDGQGHGPDLGSTEWLNAFETKARLPVTDKLSTHERCYQIQKQLESHTYLFNRQLDLTISI